MGALSVACVMSPYYGVDHGGIQCSPYQPVTAGKVYRL